MGKLEQQQQPPPGYGVGQTSALVTTGGSTKKNAPSERNAPMATIHDDDERLLAQIGYKQVRSNKTSTYRTARKTIFLLRATL